METVTRKSFGYHPGSSLTSHPQLYSCNVSILLGPQWRQELSFPKPPQPLPYPDHLPCTQAASDSRLALSFLLIPFIALLLIVPHHPFPPPCSMRFHELGADKMRNISTTSTEWRCSNLPSRNKLTLPSKPLLDLVPLCFARPTCSYPAKPTSFRGQQEKENEETILTLQLSHTAVCSIQQHEEKH